MGCHWERFLHPNVWDRAHRAGADHTGGLWMVISLGMVTSPGRVGGTVMITGPGDLTVGGRFPEIVDETSASGDFTGNKPLY